jgi:hypothetical protein
LFSSKSALFEPFLYVTLTAIAFRFPWRWVHLTCGLLAALLSSYVLFPFAQVARSYTRALTLAETYRRTLEFLGENYRRPGFVFEQYRLYKEGLEDDVTNRYFENTGGFLERAALIKPIDSLVSVTLKEGTTGWKNITTALIDLVPRMLLPRSFFNVPNELGYKAGIVLEENTGTCPSFSFAGDAFSSFGWPGVAVVSLAVGIILIGVTRLLVTGLEQNIWAITLLGAYQNQIAEGHIGGVLQTMIYQAGYTVCALLALRLAAQVLLLARRRMGRTRGKPPACQTTASTPLPAVANPAPARPERSGSFSPPEGAPA